MSEPLTDPHWDAVLARLREHPILGLATFDGVVLADPASGDPPQRYVVVYGNLGRHSGWNIRRTLPQIEFTFTVHSVGRDPAQARAVGKAVMQQLVGWTPTVPGRTCFPLAHPVSQPIGRDDDAVPPLWYGVDEFDLRSIPA